MSIASYHKYQDYLYSDIERKAVWLTLGEPAHDLLVKHLQSRLRTLRMLNHGMHTGRLENLHSLILTYAPKRLDFEPPGYRARVLLAVIEHNCNVRRAPLKSTVLAYHNLVI